MLRPSRSRQSEFSEEFLAAPDGVPYDSPPMGYGQPGTTAAATGGASGGQMFGARQWICHAACAYSGALATAQGSVTRD
jgi:hypothetical protein